MLKIISIVKQKNHTQYGRVSKYKITLKFNYKNKAGSAKFTIIHFK